MFDLSSLNSITAAEHGATLEVRDPRSGGVLANGDGRAVTLVLAGMDSERARKAERATLNRRLQVNNRRGRPAPVTAEDLDNDALDLLASCTLAWSGFVLGGSELDCTPENARKLYQQFPWLREQAQEFVNERANFLSPSPLISSS